MKNKELFNMNTEELLCKYNKVLNDIENMITEESNNEKLFNNLLNLKNRIFKMYIKKINIEMR